MGRTAYAIRSLFFNTFSACVRVTSVVFTGITFGTNHSGKSTAKLSFTAFVCKLKRGEDLVNILKHFAVILNINRISIGNIQRMSRKENISIVGKVMEKSNSVLVYVFQSAVSASAEGSGEARGVGEAGI